MSRKRTKRPVKKQSNINRNYKDSLFRMIFNNKKDLLDLYNAVNGTDYTNVDDLIIYTLEDAIYISYKNDVSFLLDDILNLYEHQSTLNPNMPVRGLLYFARSYEAYIEQNHLDIYSSVLQELPLPQYIVFYNGTTDEPERQQLELKDAFPVYPGKEPCLNCTVTMLNINYGHNRELMDRCQKLKEYALFIHYIRMNVKNNLSLEDAIQVSIETCIDQHILEDFLIKNRAEVKMMVLSSFNQENHDRILKEASKKEGIEEGIKEGLKEGIAQGQLLFLKNQVMKKLQKGCSVSEIADALEQDEETVAKIIKEIEREG